MRRRRPKKDEVFGDYYGKCRRFICYPAVKYPEGVTLHSRHRRSRRPPRLLPSRMPRPAWQPSGPAVKDRHTTLIADESSPTFFPAEYYIQSWSEYLFLIVKIVHFLFYPTYGVIQRSNEINISFLTSHYFSQQYCVHSFEIFVIS